MKGTRIAWASNRYRLLLSFVGWLTHSGPSTRSLATANLACSLCTSSSIWGFFVVVVVSFLVVFFFVFFFTVVNVL